MRLSVDSMRATNIKITYLYNKRVLIMIRDSLRGYGLISILFHWGSAIAILSLFGLGFYVVYFGYSTTTYLPYAHLHYALGLVVFAVIILRLMWRLTSKTPASLSDKTSVKLTVSAIKFF